MCEHKWISLKEVEAMAPNVCKGEVGPVEMLPAFTHVDPEKEPAVCFTCYQISGQPEGVRSDILVKFEEIIKSLS